MSKVTVVATNRRAYHEYDILETHEAGLVLKGTEVKSLREGKVSLAEAYVKPENGELWLFDMHIGHYQPAGLRSYEPARPRKLLMHREEIVNLASRVKEKGLTVVPVRLYFKDDWAKVELALARGRRLYDKREAIARRDTEREIRGLVKRRA